MEKSSFRTALLRIIQGAVIGAGAILPGVSGGVLCAAFGLYIPLMNLLANPVKELKKSYRTWAFVCIGWALGFLLFAGVLLAIFETSGSFATSLFAGLILGTLPALFREAEGKTQGGKNAKYICLACGFLLSFLLFYLLSFTGDATHSGGILPYFICGGVLGLSFIIPGLTSSSILMHLGLYAPMVEGIASFDFSVILPIFAGISLVVICLAKLVKKLFSAFYTQAYYAVIGVVICSTLVIIPSEFSGVTEIITCILAGAAGAAASFFADKKLSA